MITKTGYSKDSNIIPEGIVVTWGKEFIENAGGLRSLIKEFEWHMSLNSSTWLQKCKNKPANDKYLQYVYIIVCNRLWARVDYLGWSDKKTKVWLNDKEKETDWNYLILAGPLVRCPYKRELKGFQGFRYTEKLF